MNSCAIGPYLLDTGLVLCLGGPSVSADPNDADSRDGAVIVCPKRAEIRAVNQHGRTHLASPQVRRPSQPTSPWFVRHSAVMRIGSDRDVRRALARTLARPTRCTRRAPGPSAPYRTTAACGMKQIVSELQGLAASGVDIGDVVGSALDL